MISGAMGRGRACLLAAAACGLALSAPVRAQQSAPNPTELDPNAPLDPMPDLGVEWPDMDKPDPIPEPQPGEAAQPAAEDQAVGEAIEDAAATRRYSYRIDGLEAVAEADALIDRFKKQSMLRKDEDDPANAAQIDRRARADAELLTSLLQSEGYYDAEVETDIGLQGERIAVELKGTAGPRYTFEAVELQGIEAAGGKAAMLREAFAVKAGDPVVAEKVIAANVALKVALGEEGFALAEVGEQDVVLDHEHATARLVLPVMPGPVARFGDIRVTGSPPFSSRHVGRIARFRKGDMYERSEVDDLRRALIATGLVASVETKLVPVDGGQVVDIAVHLEPAPMRTLAGELGYGTGEGVRLEASWQHRNFFNPEGALTLRGVAGTQEQLAAVSLRRNNFKRRDQVLTAQISASNVDRDAFAAKTLLLSAGIERQSNFIWHKKWTWSLVGELIASDERDTIESTGEERRRTFFIAALPASLTYDASDDLLDPTRGFRLGGRISPELSFHAGTFGYTRAQIDASAYHPASDKIVLAGRVRLGTIFGADRDDIAPSRRFYAGGGGSVRGYGYQRLGPRDADGDPIGGRSLAEFALEARIRMKAFGGDFGIVPFFDGGTLSTKSTPDFGNWQFGAGIGLRYYSSFGPIRIDVGTPLNPQSDDGPVAVVVSLGQAF
jgi:translocation and assembly module TamA